MRLGSWWALVGVGLAVPAYAHVDPPGCSSTGIGLIVSMYRADGTHGASGAVSECERVSYRVTLQKADPDACAVSGGTLTLITPDGVAHVVAADVPCIGAAGSGSAPCPTATSTFAGPIVAYAVRPGDAVGGILTATARYEGGVFHDADHETSGARLSSERRAELVVCDDADPTTIDACDPAAPGPAACSHATTSSHAESGCQFTSAALACEVSACAAP